MDRWIALGSTVLTFSGCSEYDLVDALPVGAQDAPNIRVDPPTLTWPTLSSGEEQVQTFTITNDGGNQLDVSDVAVDAGLGFQVITEQRELLLNPGESAPMEVAFTPKFAHENYGRVLVFSNDHDEPESPVDLLGDGAVPELQITPEDHTFGDTFVPCGISLPVELRNVGVEDLTITEISYASAGFLSLDASSLTLPVTLAPGEARDVTVSFAAVTLGSDTGTLSVTSNDPRGIVDAWQNGEGIYLDEQVERFTEPGVPPVDVLMLVDQSCSMEADNTDDVELGLPIFLDTLETVADWQLIQITGDAGCANQGVLTQVGADTEQQMVEDAFGLSDPQMYGGVYLTESLLELGAKALAQTGPGGCNEGFVRPGALLHLLILSDEPEQSGVPYADWLDEFATYAVSPDYVRVSTVVDIDAGCGEGAAGYIEAAGATGGAVLDICNNSWGPAFDDIAVSIAEGVRSYTLSDIPDPGSVTVVVNGVPTSGFSVVGGSVTIQSPAVGPDDLVEIAYAVLAECTT
jgi:hypothetical protein